jgi:hypothetical protein
VKLVYLRDVFRDMSLASCDLSRDVTPIGSCDTTLDGESCDGSGDTTRKMSRDVPRDVLCDIMLRVISVAYDTWKTRLSAWQRSATATEGVGGRIESCIALHWELRAQNEMKHDCGSNCFQMIFDLIFFAFLCSAISYKCYLVI